jgi:hypothetical protein
MDEQDSPVRVRRAVRVWGYNTGAFLLLYCSFNANVFDLRVGEYDSPSVFINKFYKTGIALDAVSNHEYTACRAFDSQPSASRCFCCSGVGRLDFMPQFFDLSFIHAQLPTATLAWQMCLL